MLRAVFPGRPQPDPQAIDSCLWLGRRIIVRRCSRQQIERILIDSWQVYISGNALSILSGPNELLQTIHDQDEDKLTAIRLLETTGQIATCTSDTVKIYSPFGEDEEDLRVRLI